MLSLMTMAMGAGPAEPCGPCDDELVLHAVPERAATPRSYLMCPPFHFTVSYAINPWMRPDQPADARRAVRQWERLRQIYTDLGHTVHLIEPLPGLPDMVFAANGATVVDGSVLGARFRHPERAAEASAYLDWFRGHGYASVRAPRLVNEGEGDILCTGPRLLAGLFSELIEATDADAAVLGLNAVSDGRHVVLPEQATDLTARLAEHGFEPIGVDLSELRKAGGGPKCCTLELRG